jgi:hypothetical protein
MSGTEKGAVGGAAAGGLLGALVAKNKLLGAVVGAFAGAVVGAVIGNYYDKQVASRAEAAKKYEYKTNEEKLEIEDSSVSPLNIAPGVAVESNVQYTVLSPVETQSMKITEIRTLSDGKEMTELAKREVMRAQGTHISTMKFTMPKDIDKGGYTLITTISDGKQIKTTKNQMKVI